MDAKPQRSSATVASADGGKPLADPRRAVTIQGLDKSTLVDTLTSIDMIDVDMKSLELIQCCRPLGASRLSDGEAEAIAGLFQGARPIPARVKIVNMLATRGEPVCACEFHPALGLASGDGRATT